MKRIIALVLTTVMIFMLFAACGNAAENQETADTKSASSDTKENISTEIEDEQKERIFVDDLGRSVQLPNTVSKIAVSGPLTQIYVLPIASDIMVGFASEFSNDAKKYISEEVLKLPSLGQLYGGKGTMDLEALLDAAPEVVIDIGEEKDNMTEDLDDLSKQTGIPFVHINATVDTSASTYRRLGQLLNREAKAEELAKYLEDVLADVDSIMEKVDNDNARKTVLYCLGDKGLNVLAEKSYHAETINLVAKNCAEIEEVNASGAGNEVDMEQIILWNPEVIIFAPESVYESVSEDSSWKQLDAIKDGKYYETPFGPYGWLQSPPAIQRYLGLMWLTSILYPDYCDFDLKDNVIEYYKIFYDYDLSESEYEELVSNAVK